MEMKKEEGKGEKDGRGEKGEESRITSTQSLETMGNNHDLCYH